MAGSSKIRFTADYYAAEDVQQKSRNVFPANLSFFEVCVSHKRKTNPHKWRQTATFPPKLTFPGLSLVILSGAKNLCFQE
jgi:hypothetical protein